MKNIIALICVLFLNSNLLAKRFASQYAEFQLPPNWECALEGTEWVCQSSNKGRKREAIIIMAAKIRGPSDDLGEYKAYLKKPKTFSLPGGKTQVSEAKYSKVNEIKGHRWVDALHMASEVPGFYTRYLATVKEDLGIAVTFSVSKDHYSSYQKVFDNVIATLNVFRQKQIDADKFQIKTSTEDLIGDTTFIPQVDENFGIGTREASKKGQKSGSGDTYFYIIIIAAVAIIIMKKRGKKGTKKKKKK